MTPELSTVGPSIRCEDVVFRYPRAETAVLRGVSFEIGDRGLVGVLGPNGGGKTTLLKLVLGLETARRGRIEVLGTSPARARRRVGYVPQIPTVDPTMPADVLDVVLLGRLRSGLFGPRWSAEDRDASVAALERVRALDLARRPWTGLSGGQRQRVLIARALAGDSRLLLLDEPTAGVDMHREHALLHLLEDLAGHLPVVLVTHDLALVTAHADAALWVDGTVRPLSTDDLSIRVIEGLLHHRHATAEDSGRPAEIAGEEPT